MRRIFNRLKGKSWEDILLRIIKELFAVYARSKKREKVLVSPSFDKKRQEVDFRLINWTYRNSAEDEIISEATKVLEHRFDLLGSQSVKVSYDNMDFEFEGFQYQTQLNRARTFCAIDKYEPIDWHCDFKSGFRWDGNLVYSKVRKTSDGLPGVDIKLPWELSRFQHLTVLLKAYELSKDEKYIQEILYQIGDWIYNNRPFHGVNWTCTMDVAIRLANWSFAMSFIQENFNLNPSFLRIYNRSFRNHVLYIMTNLEWTKRLSSNHYLSDISGLYVSLVMRGRKSVLRVWAKSRLEKEIIKQTYNDGMNFEASTSYHRLALELFSFPVFLSPVEFSSSYLEMLKKMYSLSFWITRKDGSIPVIGDNDSGIFFKTSLAYKVNHHYLVELWKQVFPKLEIPSFKKGSILFPVAGLFIFRNQQSHLVLANMPNGQNGNGGHSHNDKLSIDLWHKGQPFIVDPGTFVYTPFPKERNRYRKTSYHNTIALSKLEQNDLSIGLFKMNRKATEQKNSFRELGNGDIEFEGSHDYFSTLDSNIIHTRTIKITSSKVILNDRVSSSSEDIVYSAAVLLIPKQIIKEVNGNNIFTSKGKIEASCSKWEEGKTIRRAASYGELQQDLIQLKIEFVSSLTVNIYFE